ncbi:MAG: cyclase family protein [Synergistaceae bacterium]|jgi:kynurenine formamidase|nr:cyclase family protein [Synergistaceae bacterium]
MYKLLSYPISKQATAWPGAKLIQTVQTRHVGEGSEWNEWEYVLPNHLGSHYDAPNHHFDGGMKIADLPLEQFIFEKPFILDVPKGFNEKITRSDLVPHEERIKRCDALLLRSGFSKYYNDPEIYGKKGPAVGSDAAEYLNKTFPKLKAILLDFISLNTYTDVQDGVIAHKWLLGEWTDNYICIVEDMTMEGVENDTLEKIIALPLFIKEIDSAQVTILAFVKDV